MKVFENQGSELSSQCIKHIHERFHIELKFFQNLCICVCLALNKTKHLNVVGPP